MARNKELRAKMCFLTNAISVQHNSCPQLTDVFMLFNKMLRPARKLKVIGDKLFMEHVSNGLPVIIFFKLVLLCRIFNFKA